MKKKVVSSLLIVTTLLIVFNVMPITTAYAAPLESGTAYGKAYIPYFLYQKTDANAQTDAIYVSNITDNPIDVSITLYDQNGSIIKDDGNIDTGVIIGSSYRPILDYNDNPSGNASVTLTLDAHNTRMIALSPSATTSGVIGSGIIEWTQDDSSVLHGMIAQVINYEWPYPLMTNALKLKMDVDINGGLPF